MTNGLIYNNVNEFLLNRNWRKSDENARYNIYLPSIDLKFEKGFKLYIPNQYEKPDFESNIIKIVETLSLIYNEDADELTSIILEDRQILQLHIDDDSILAGKPSIPFFDTLLSKVKDLLQNSATYMVTKKPHFYEQVEESERYLNLCRFMKNSEGSLITKIQLPNKEDIKERNVFENPINGADINKGLIGIISFVNDDLLKEEFILPDEAYLKMNQNFISVNVIDKVQEFYKGIGLQNVEISLKGTAQPTTTYVSELNNHKIDSVKKFTKVVKEKMNEILNDEIIYGKVISLNSKDIDSDKNTIKVEAQIKNIKSEVIVKLSPEDYQNAIKAHSLNKSVLIKGVLEKEKTRYKLTELHQFKVLST